MKAAGLLNVDEAMKLAGIQSLTIAPDLLRTLSDTTEPEKETSERSMFKKNTRAEGQALEYTSYVDDESKFRKSFARSEGGKGQVKTSQVRALFTFACERLVDALVGNRHLLRISDQGGGNDEGPRLDEDRVALIL